MSRAVTNAIREMFEYYRTPRDPHEPPMAMVSVYLRQLEQFPEPAVLAAIEQAYATHTFRPKVSELTEIMGNMAAGQNDNAETAWLEVQREARRVGYRTSKVFHNGQFHDPPKPEFSSPLVAEAVEVTTWKVICTGNNDNGEIAENFKWAYRNLRSRSVKQIQRGEFGTSGPALPAANGQALERGKESA